MLVIGFANKYYTLWDVIEHIENNGYSKYVWYTYSFIKNISMDKEKTFNSYPNINFDETLKGKTITFITEKKEVWDNVDTFRYGRYKGKKITEINDIKYIEWYYNNIWDEEHKKYIIGILIDNGYSFDIVKWVDSDNIEHESKCLIDPKTKIELDKSNIRFNVLKNSVKNNEIIEIKFLKNLDSNGNYYDNNIIYHFNNYDLKTYNGYDYALPILNNKSKRIKNKTIKITNYTYVEIDNNLEINIENFEIIK